MLRPLAVAVTLLVLVLPLSHSHAADGKGLIRITQRTAKEADYGLYDVTTGYLRDRHGIRIGWAIVTCFPLGKGGPLGDGTSYCASTFSLPLGRIQTVGTRKTQTSYLQAIVGGTGIYASAGGSLLVRTYSYDPRVELLLFNLT